VARDRLQRRPTAVSDSGSPAIVDNNRKTTDWPAKRPCSISRSGNYGGTVSSPLLYSTLRAAELAPRDKKPGAVSRPGVMRTFGSCALHR
jgi:hypothetical protein